MDDDLNPRGKTEHGCAIVLGSHGLLIKGPSGSGKSQLSRALIDRWRLDNLYSSWIADDRVILTASGTKIVVKPAPVLAGLNEQRFGGIQWEPYLGQAIVDYVIELVFQNKLERLPELRTISPVAGCDAVPVIQVPMGNPTIALALLSQALRDTSL